MSIFADTEKTAFLKDDVNKILKSRILETIVDGEKVYPLQ